MSNPQIAIIGAGPGGLLLARYLQINSISCTIYERESSRDHRSQGGSLDLHAEGGLLALKEVGLMDEFEKFARKEGDSMRILDKTGKVWYEDEPQGEGPGRPEIDRTDLRDILLDSLQLNTVQWDHCLISVTPSDSSSGYVLNFANRASTTTDILIGADGAWSRIRPLITTVLPTYSCISFIEFVISDVDNRFPHLASLVGQGTAFIASDTKGLIPQRNSKGVVRIYAKLKVPENWIEENPLPADPGEAKKFVASLFPGWDPSVLEFIKSADDAPIVARKIIALPPSHTWTTQLHGITLLGDAAHVMSPFAGEGVNLALLDAYEIGAALVRALEKGKGLSAQEVLGEVNKGFRTYERGMWKRAQEKGEESAANLGIMFAEDAPRAFVEQFESYRLPPE